MKRKKIFGNNPKLKLYKSIDKRSVNQASSSNRFSLLDEAADMDIHGERRRDVKVSKIKILQ